LEIESDQSSVEGSTQKWTRVWQLANRSGMVNGWF